MSHDVASRVEVEGEVRSKRATENGRDTPVKRVRSDGGNEQLDGWKAG